MCFGSLAIYRRKAQLTSGLEPPTCSLRVSGHGLLTVAGACNSCIGKGFLLPVLLAIAACCVWVRVKLGPSGVGVPVLACLVPCRCRSVAHTLWLGPVGECGTGRTHPTTSLGGLDAQYGQPCSSFRGARMAVRRGTHSPSPSCQPLAPSRCASSLRASQPSPSWPAGPLLSPDHFFAASSASVPIGDEPKLVMDEEAPPCELSK